MENTNDDAKRVHDPRLDHDRPADLGLVAILKQEHYRVAIEMPLLMVLIAILVI